MKKILLILGIIIIVYIIFIFLPLGTKTYKSERNGLTFEVPIFSIFKEECCMTSANFISIRSTYSLKKEIEKTLNNYEKITCNGKTHYYNKEQDFTISEYFVENGIIFNRFNFVFDNGNYCNQIDYQINVYSVNSFVNINNYTNKNILMSLKASNDISKIKKAFTNAKKIDGILDVLSPNYLLEKTTINNEEKEYIYLWLTNKSETAMIMYGEDTHTGYTISIEDTEMLKELIIK